MTSDTSPVYEAIHHRGEKAFNTVTSPSSRMQYQMASSDKGWTPKMAIWLFQVLITVLSPSISDLRIHSILTAVMLLTLLPWQLPPFSEYIYYHMIGNEPNVTFCSGRCGLVPRFSSYYRKGQSMKYYCGSLVGQKRRVTKFSGLIEIEITRNQDRCQKWSNTSLSSKFTLGLSKEI